MCSFGLTSMYLSVMFDLKDNFMPSVVRIRLTAFETPHMYGGVIIGPLASC